MKKLAKWIFIFSLSFVLVPLISLRLYGYYSRHELKPICKNLRAGMDFIDFMKVITEHDFKLVTTMSKSENNFNYTFSKGNLDCNVEFKKNKLEDRYFGFKGSPGESSYIIEDWD